MKKLITYYNFVVVAFIVFSGFLAAESASQLLVATLFYPIFVYFSLLVIPNRQKAILLPKEITQPKKKVTKLKRLDKGDKKFDIDRRAFIKLVGSGGVAVFFLSVFGVKKAQAAFFGSVPGPGIVGVKDSSGTQIDPAEKHPTDGYKIARLDESSPAYYGFINKDGAWFIMREESDGTYKYQKGAADFLTTGWNIRNTTLTYDDFDVIF